MVPLAGGGRGDGVLGSREDCGGVLGDNLADGEDRDGLLADFVFGMYGLSTLLAGLLEATHGASRFLYWATLPGPNPSGCGLL